MFVVVSGTLSEQLHEAKGHHVNHAHLGAASSPLFPARLAIPLLCP